MRWHKWHFAIRGSLIEFSSSPILTLNSDLVCCDSGAKIKPQNMEKPVRQTDHTAMEDVCTELLSHLAFIKMYMIFFFSTETTKHLK